MNAVQRAHIESRLTNIGYRKEASLGKQREALSDLLLEEEQKVRVKEIKDGSARIKDEIPYGMSSLRLDQVFDFTETTNEKFKHLRRELEQTYEREMARVEEQRRKQADLSILGRIEDAIKLIQEFEEMKFSVL